MIPMMASFPPTNITTEQIQKYLDENKKLILAILDNQNLGKLAECAQYQTVLQKNLMYLAAIADAQPQSTPSMPSQMAPHPTMQQGGYYMQHPQAVAAAMAQQQQSTGIFSPKVPIQFNNPHPMQDAPQLHQQAFQAQMGMRPHPMHTETTSTHGVGSSSGPLPTGGLNDVLKGSKPQDASEAGGAASHGGGGGDGEPSYSKGSDDAK